MSAKSYAAVTIGICVLLNAGCTSSAYPLTGEPTEVLDLSGSWSRTPEAGLGPPQIVVNGSKANSRYTASVGKKEMTLSVMTIGTNFYVNAKLRFDGHDDEGEAGLPTLLIPLNLFARVELYGDELHVFPIDEKSSRGFLTRHKVAYIETERCFHVLTVSSDMLRDLVAEHGNTLFTTSPTKYVRRKSDNPN